MAKLSAFYRFFAPGVLALWVIGLLVLFPRPIVIFPNYKDFGKSTYTDSGKKGASEIIGLKKSYNTIEFSYILKKGIDFPYCGLVFFFSPSIYFNAADYDSLVLRLKADNLKQLEVRRNEFIPGLTEPGNAYVSRPVTASVAIDDEWKDYEIPLRGMRTADWFVDDYHITDKNLIQPQPEYFSGIVLQNAEARVNERITLSVQSIRLVKKPLPFIVATALLALLLAAGGVALRLAQRKPARFMEAKPLELKHYTDEEEGKVLDYLRDHYFDPDISLRVINRVTGIPEERITRAVHKASGMPLKKYLNVLRLQEAKRQLAQTDRPVTEIAMMLGYNNTTPFNRVFREMEGASPTDYRKNKGKK